MTTDTSSGLPAALALLTAADLDRMTRRAWTAAAVLWREHDQPRPGVAPQDCRQLRAMLYDDALAADEWWRTLRDEQSRRAAEPTP